ncbi:prepilin peptidase [Synechococcus sp. BSF8S]|uniref:prepilin peptidase n=1 Tax=Synechococcales TaxID=1890424 RepID=UPI001629E240|nr:MULTISPECIES: A24 family peptidase [unclassified Synechococcus]MBC1261124.1 prepilin peptidase [Synechococcus sp. BSF8S]MBC1264027.1 prepilin peptidase [Synechococcus sp. BSA11S]
MPVEPVLAANALIPLLVALLGACVGSFLNVVAWRLPRRESLVAPASHCPRCGIPLAWHQNLPVLGWLLLRGRCGHCRGGISPRYPLVELLCAGLWVAALEARPSALGEAPAWLLIGAGWLLISWLLPLVLIDGDHLWLPEPLCRWGLLLGLLITLAAGLSQSQGIARALVFNHLLAACLGLLAFEGLSALAERLIGKPALGLGDAKLTAMLGAWLGLSGMGLAVALAVFSGAVVGLLGRLSGRLGPGQPFPFGPFLALGAVAVWLAGEGWWMQQWSRWGATL